MQKDKVKKAAGLAVGSSMMLMSMIPAASVFAATNNHFITSVTTSVSGDTATASSVTNPTHLHVWYQFRVETPAGHWFIAQKFGPSDTKTFVPPISSSGTWYIEAYALTQYQAAHHMWGNAVGSTPQKLAPAISKLAIEGLPSTDIATNQVLTLTAVPENAAGSPVTLSGQATWTVTTASGATTSGATIAALATGDQAVFDATTPGDYTITVTLDGITGTASADVFGEATAVQVSPASATLIADGKATDTITATVVDSNGNVVSNFNGSATVELSGLSSVTASTSTVTFTNGVGSFTITGETAGSETVTLSGLTAASGSTESTTITYGSATITLATPVATGLMISPTSATMLAAPSQAEALTVEVVDQLGNPIPSNFANGFDVVTLNIVGPGSFQSGVTSATSETVYVAAGLPASVDVYDPTGTTGNILVTGSASGLTEGVSRIVAAPIGLPTMISVTSTTGTTSAALTSSSNGINLSSGTQYTEYTVTLEDANGTPVPAPSAETFAVTDNAATGKAYLTSVTSTGQPTGMASAITASGAATTATVTLDAGSSSMSFDVVNTTTQSAPATITVATTGTDYAMVYPVSAVLSASASAPYTFVTGPVATVDVTGPGDVLQGGTATYTAQISDINDNPVAATGTVTFTISESTTGVATFANGATTVTGTLNSNGTASITVDAGTTTGTYTVTASADGFSGTASGSVVDLASLVTNLAVETGSPLASVTSSGVTIGGLGAATFTVYQRNGVDAPVAPTDNITVSVSNASGAILENSSGDIQAGSSLTLSPSAFTGTNLGATFTILGGTAGTVTVTVSDASNPSVPSVSFPVTVQGMASTAIQAAGETGAGNVAGDTATITVNGTTTTAAYASALTDFATYNQQAGELDVLTPTIISGTVYSGTTSVWAGDLAVWDVGNNYYYLALDETGGSGSAANTYYVGIEVTAPTGSTVQMAINSGSYDGNLGTTDYAYIAVATGTGTSFSVASPTTFVLNTKVSLPSPGPTIVYPMGILQP